MMRAATCFLCLVLLSTGALAQVKGYELRISHLTGDFYIFTTYGTYKGSTIPANGMYLVTRSGVVMFDTPWDTTQFQPLLDSIKIRHNKDVVACISTHFHGDRTGGLDYYKHKGVKTFTTRKTDMYSANNGMPRAEYLIDKDTVFNMGQYSFQTFYPGPGHTADNIVLWFPKAKVLYAGCLVKCATDTDLGNLADGNTKEYANTIKRLQAKFLGPIYVIPGHGDWNDTSALTHTLQMAEELQRK